MNQPFAPWWVVDPTEPDEDDEVVERVRCTADDEDEPVEALEYPGDDEFDDCWAVAEEGCHV